MKKVLTISFLLFITSFIFGQSEFKPEIKIGATIFSGWEYNLDNAEFLTKVDTNSPDANSMFGFKPLKNQFETNKNSFYVSRSYINVIASLTPQISAKVVPDIFSYTDGNGKTQWAFDLKLANVYYTPYKCESGMSITLGAGLIPNNWLGAMDRYWGYRGFSNTLTDVQWTTSAARNGVNISRTTSTYFPTVDLGLDVALNLPKGFGELSFEILNGNGFRNLSFDNRFKDILFSATLHPLAIGIAKKTEAAKKMKKDRIVGITDLTVGGFTYIGKLDKGENYTTNGVQYKRNRFGGMAHIRLNFRKSGFVKIGGEYSVQSNEDPSSVKPDSLVKTNATGLSVYIEINPPVESLNEKLMVFGRFDMFDPNTVNQNSSLTTFNDNTDKQSLLIMGLVFKPAKVLTIGLNYHMIMFDKDYIVKYDGTASKSEAKLMFQTILNF